MNPLKNVTLIAAVSIAAFATLAHADDSTASANEKVLTRAQVIADMQVWNEAGVPAMIQHRDGPLHPDFLVALAKYEQLRAAPEFAQRVAAIERERGERVDTASPK